MSRTGRFLRKLGLVVVVVLFLAAPASASLHEVTDTDLIGRTDLPHPPLDPGSKSEGFVLAEFCMGPMGLNPFEGSFVFTLEVLEAPEWVDIEVLGDLVYQPPAVPALDLGMRCEFFDYWQLWIEIDEDAPTDTAGVVLFELRAQRDGDTGTYQKPGSVELEGLLMTSSGDSDA